MKPSHGLRRSWPRLPTLDPLLQGRVAAWLVFFWNSRKYQETGEFQYALAGNAPLIVDLQDGSVHDTSTAYPVEEIIGKRSSGIIESLMLRRGDIAVLWEGHVSALRNR